jgi:hypothetical protein
MLLLLFFPFHSSHEFAAAPFLFHIFHPHPHHHHRTVVVVVVACVRELNFKYCVTKEGEEGGGDGKCDSSSSSIER